jgi:gas vesicle protein
MAEFRTDPGDRSVAELEREVDAERARLSNTIDALQSKASMGNIVDEIVRAVRDNGGDMGRNLGRTVRDNPLPALLTGVGLAWLMAGSGAPARRWEDDDYDYGRGYRQNPIPVGDRVSASGFADSGAGLGTSYDAPSAYVGTGDDDGPGLRERAADSISGLGASASGALDDAGRRVSSLAGAAGDRVSDAGHAARAGLHRARHRAAHAGTDARETFDDLLENQPLVLGALALALGAAIGGALPGSRTEDRMFGERSDRAKQTLRHVAEEEGRKLEATASAVADEAGRIVDEASAEVADRLPEGRSAVDAAADRVKDAAGRLQKAGTDEAERQDLGHPKSTV